MLKICSAKAGKEVPGHSDRKRNASRNAGDAAEMRLFIQKQDKSALKKKIKIKIYLHTIRKQDTRKKLFTFYQ